MIKFLADFKSASFKYGKENLPLEKYNNFWIQKVGYKNYENGHLAEAISCFILGLISQVLKLYVHVSWIEDKKHGIDFRINGIPVQQKLNWEEENIDMSKYDSIVMFFLHSYDEAGNTMAMDEYRKLLYSIPNIKNEDIDDAFDNENNIDVFDKIEEVWDSFLKKSNLNPK